MNIGGKMDMKDSVFLIMKQDGTVFSIAKNNSYSNHYQYLNDLKKQDPFLTMNSFGLTFTRDDNTAQVMFFESLVTSGCIVFQNESITPTDDLDTICLYLPSNISDAQKDFLLNQEKDFISGTKFVFLEVYNSEDCIFNSLCKNVQDLNNAFPILKEYISTHSLSGKSI